MNTLFKKSSKTFFGLFLFFLSFVSFAQEQKKDSAKVNALDEVVVTSTRLKEKSPFTFSTVKKEELKSTNLGQDLPILLDQMPSVVTTSDAGLGVGYTGLRVRGSDATRVNVTLNGIPYNDAESHGTFWVNMPDFASSVEDIQLQRGAGTSTNGTGAFGASLNLRTLKPSEKGYATISNSIGSFGTRKHTFSIGSGIKNGFYVEGRLSKIASNGYIDRATSDLKSFYGEAGFVGNKTSVKAIVFGGKEITYQSWYGTPEAVVRGDLVGIQAFIDRNYSTPEEAANLLNSGRTYNYYTYKDQVDNYGQNHYQLHFAHQFTENLNLSISGNYTKGKGFYEDFKSDKKLKKYFPESSNGSVKGDVVLRKWLDNDFYAFVYSLNYQKQNWNVNLGGGYNRYVGNHFGQIIWNSFPVAVTKDAEYYRADGLKEDYSSFLKADYTIAKTLIVFGDVQARRVDYSANGMNGDLKKFNVNKTYHFFNPKAGLTYLIDDYNSLYGSVSVANKEPNRDDLTKNPVEPNAEKLIDYELGYRFKNNNYSFNLNGYYMDYKNQLVLTGAIDDTGGPIRENVGESYRMGLEVMISAKILKNLKVGANATLSQNKIKSFDYKVADTQYDPVTYDESYFTVITKYEDTDISFSPSLISGGSLTYTPIKNLDLQYLIKYVDSQYLDNTSNKTRMIDGYSTSNFVISYAWKPKWIKEINFNLLVNNLFNRMYESNGYTYSYYYRPSGSTDNAITENFYYPQAGINFIIGMTLKF
ncbi:MAG: TonB-dependent receptor [Limnohabitans sp.]|nr:TonB-dependent receptor [Limnohabitans sp.]